MIIDELAEYFEKFPGIGKRQSKRFVYFLLKSDKKYLTELTRLIDSLKNSINQCESCFIYHNSNESECEVCSDKNTDRSLLMVVEKDADYENIKRSNTYNGMYFILGGLVPLIESDIPKKIRAKELESTVKSRNELKEIIIALSMTPQGEQTDLYIRKILSKYKVKISSLGRGLSTGTELEYSDDNTLVNAFKNRS